MLTALLIALLLMLASCRLSPPQFDAVIRGGTLYDGSGRPGRRAALAIKDGRIAAIGEIPGKGVKEIDATGLAVSPGFINMLSWATESLLQDGRSQSDIHQGVTLEIFGEGDSMGPLNPKMQSELERQQGDIRYKVEWTTLGEYLEHLEDVGVSANVASFVGATTVRVHEIGYANRKPSPAEFERMRVLVRQAMEDGALGLGSALIYAPGAYASTEELVGLAGVAGSFGGIYISHLRSEGDRLLEAVDELITIARNAKVPAEIYHLKAAGAGNWAKMDPLIRKIEAARKQGLRITADMYPYTAGATGLDAAMPPWVQEGGYLKWAARLQVPAIRQRLKNEMTTPSQGWENLLLAAGSPDRVLLVGFKNPSLKPLTGKSLAEVASLRGTSPEETAMDLVVEDGSRVDAVYFLMPEDQIAAKIRLPWMSFGSDAASLAPDGVFLQSNPHPRAYGTFARLLGKYVREEKVIPLPEAIRRLTSLPAANLRIQERGWLRIGYFADVVVFDPNQISDHATFQSPHQYSTGVYHVFVNGVQVLKNGAHTGARPGRVVRGPGWSP